MVDFRKLRLAETGNLQLDPIEIFRTLPKPEHVNDLWDTQAAALRAWRERREERDLAIKLNTGSGKTLVGLLIGESLRRETRGPILYLAPTRQLGDQVAEKAAEFGIPVELYGSGQGLPSSFQNGEAILVSTYHALFNGRSVFGLLGRREPVPVAGIVLDDAHASASIMRDIFSISIDRSENADLYRDIVGRFRLAFEQIHSVGRLDDMLAGREEGVLEVPYWAWIESAAAVREQIQALPEERFRFSLPLVRDFFEFSHALISREAFTITPLLPPVHMIPSFSDRQRRVFMSATLADDGVLVRTFAATPASITRPITTRSVAGMGERMILAPTLSGLDRQQAVGAVVKLAAELREDGKGAVVLVPSERQAESWAEHGDVCTGDAVSVAVEQLNDPATRGSAIQVFVNRYDGIDLPQDACRLLVLDGKPRGANQYDLYRATMLSGISSINIGLAQRVEQGMGRGTRGAGDYCVVLLLGNDLVEWLGRRDTQDVLTPGTRIQVGLGREVAGQIANAEELLETARQCLERDEEWKQVHAQRLAGAGEDPANTEVLVAAGRLERRAFEKLLYQRPMEACEILREAAAEGEWDNSFKGWLLQLAARAALMAGEHELAERLQSEAHGIHRSLLKPRGQIKYERVQVITAQAANVVNVIEQYAIRSSVLEAIDNALADLHPEASANRFEEAIRSLGSFLGFASERPESSSREGPDNLWLSEFGVGYVIECKHLKTSPINKEEHGQLRVSVEWFSRHYENYEAVPVIVHRDGFATTNSQAVESGARALTFSELGRIKAALKAVYRELAFSAGSPDVLEAKAGRLLATHKLDVQSFQGQYLTPFRSLA